MDTRKIVEAEGYRFEDLKENNQAVMNWLNWFKNEVIEHLETEYAEEDDDGILDRALKEIVADVRAELAEYLEVHLNEIQIGLAESQEE